VGPLKRPDLKTYRQKAKKTRLKTRDAALLPGGGLKTHADQNAEESRKSRPKERQMPLRARAIPFRKIRSWKKARAAVEGRETSPKRQKLKNF